MDFKYIFSYTRDDSGDIIRTNNLCSGNILEAIRDFYSFWKGDSSRLTTYESNLLINATLQMTIRDAVAFYNMIMTDCEIVGIQKIVTTQVYPEE